MVVPHRFEKRVREAEVEDVHDRLLPQVVVDAKDRRLGEHGLRHGIQFACRREISAERFLDDDPRVLRQTCNLRLCQVLDDGAEQRWRYRQIECWSRRMSQRGLQGSEGGRVVVVAADAVDQGQQAVERGRVVDAANVVFMHQAVAHLVVPFGDSPIGRGHSDHRHRQLALLHHRIQRREDLPANEVASETEDDQGIGMRPLGLRAGSCSEAHRASSVGFSTWPPKACRMAEST